MLSKQAVKDSPFSSKTTINVRGKVLDLTTPKVMGVLNVTPDSFYEDSRVASSSQGAERASAMIEEGAAMIDIGGYSSRPGAADIPESEERDRVLPVIEEIIKYNPEAILSIDTFRSGIARQAYTAGASIINDISGGLLDDQMIATVAQLGCPYVLMHMRGTPLTMKDHSTYEDVALEVVNELLPQVKKLESAGVNDVIIDPGFGFAKSIDQNYELLRNLPYFKTIQRPVLVGISRKSMIYRYLSISSRDSLNGTTVLNTLALQNGANILRVHDIREAVEVVNLVDKYANA